MALSTEVSARSYAGNNSTSTAYVVDFRVDEASHIRVSTKDGAAAAVLLDPSAYTVTQVTGGWEVRTLSAIANTITVTVFRWVPLTQLLEFPPMAKFNPQLLEQQGLDRLMMAVQQIRGMIDGGGVISAPGASVLGVQTVANAAGRAAATPAYAGQPLVQLDTAQIYAAGSTAPGNWLPIDPGNVRYFSTLAALQAATPASVGQVCYCEGEERGALGLPIGRGFYRGVSLTAGGWARLTGNYGGLSDMPWRGNEPLRVGERRWCGYIPSFYLFVHHAKVCFAESGSGDIAVRVYVGGKLLSVDFVSVAGETDPRTITGFGWGLGDGLDSYWNTGSGGTNIPNNPIAYNMPVEVEIVSIGTVGAMVGSAGSFQSTPSGAAASLMQTGAAVTQATGETIHVLAVQGDGTRIMSYPATSGSSQSIAGAQAIFARGVYGLTNVTGDTVITVPALTAQLARVGDIVVGPTVEAGTVLIGVGASSVTLSKPLLADTAQIGILSDERSRAFHFTSITASGGATTVSLPVTTGIRAGDTVKGTNVAANTIVASLTAGSITLNNALSGAITELTITYPERTATAAAGATSLTLNNGTGVPVGAPVTGPGVSAGTVVSSVAGNTAVLSKAITLAMSGTPLLFGRDTCDISGTLTSGADTLTLAIPVSSTSIEVGWFVAGTGIPTGTFVTAISGSQITLSNNSTVSGSQALAFERTREWKGLQLTIFGEEISYTS
jgi:hypothetical protein